MRFSIFIAASILSVAGFSAAFPTPTKSGCCQLAPNAVARVEEALPEESHLPGFIVGQESGKTRKKDTFMEFYTPPNSYGCQLVSFFPAGAVIDTDEYPVARIDVYRVTSPLRRDPWGIDVSWNWGPDLGDLVGSVRFESKRNESTKVVINSFQCDRSMAFRFRVASEDNNYVDTRVPQNLHGGGVQMIYNC